MVSISFPGVSRFVGGARRRRGRHRAAVGHRRYLSGADPGRHLQQRLRAVVAPGAEGRRRARAAGRPGLGAQAREPGRSDLHCEPDAAAPDARPDRVHRDTSVLRAGDDGPALADQLGERHSGADVLLELVAGRADRRRLRVDAEALPRPEGRESSCRTACTRARSTGALGLARVPRPVRRKATPDPGRIGIAPITTTRSTRQSDAAASTV
jgi:hypothetical protein